MDLNNTMEKKTILVSGAYSDMAKTTLKLLKKQYNFVLLGRDFNKITEVITTHLTSSDVKLTCVGDISDEISVRKMADHLRNSNIRLSGIVNFCGGQPVVENIHQLNISHLQTEINTRVIGNVNIVKEFHPFLNNGASIVIINGILSKLPEPNFLCGSISTAAVRSLVKCLSKQFSPTIRVNAINPCASDTKMKDKLLSFLSKNSGISLNELEDGITNKIPMGRLCSPTDIANCVNFLLSDNSSFITGISIDIDGGYNNSIN
ncbi:SDR family NAD(P)-dependent oxidoreductase [Enterobacter ludwigii]|uniref:SDR family NAD(P)-dependent oxidoreductase n=1 Tax=Enterobacter ludwigii TaxID=299767 RepID=UPI0008FFA405|nr:SDR family oxidoreductase [Enterobacter ludwigii]